jgi:cytochrome c-type biogenesis protein CcmH
VLAEALGTDALAAQQASGPDTQADTSAARGRAGTAGNAAADSVIPAPLSGEGAIGTLGDPGAAGRSLDPTTRRDNDAAIKAIELKLTCTCGCTLDIYTCRTTDFTCTYSPRLHREIVAMYDGGKTAQQIIDTFIAEYGEKVLMAPKPTGFNLAGYLVPGAAVTVAAGALVWVIRRRELQARAGAGPAFAGPAVRPADAAAPGAEGATPAELERLARALRESDD